MLHHLCGPAGVRSSPMLHHAMGPALCCIAYADQRVSASLAVLAVSALQCQWRAVRMSHTRRVVPTNITGRMSAGPLQGHCPC
jgi:hypothetical protein